MTTLAQARTELSTALGAVMPVGDLDGIQPPGVMIYGEGVDPAHLARGQVEASFRLTFVGGAWDGKAASADLSSLVTLALPILAGLAGWRVGAFSPDSVVQVAGSRLLSIDAVASRMVDI